MRKLFLLLGSIVFFAVQALAQRTVTGKVSDDKGAPLQNVSVLAKGTTIGTTTKADGTYSISVPTKTKSLIFSSVDMATLEIVIEADNTVDVTLRTEEKIMAEVVVTGYGTQKRKEVTGSISTIKGPLIANKPVQSFEQALGGRAGGCSDHHSKRRFK
jgi:hypothetical protein